MSRKFGGNRSCIMPGLLTHFVQEFMVVFRREGFTCFIVVDFVINLSNLEVVKYTISHVRREFQKKSP